MVWKLFSTKVTEHELDQALEQTTADIGRRIRDTDINLGTAYHEIKVLNKRLSELYERDFRTNGDRMEAIDNLTKVVEHMGTVAVERTAQIQALSSKISELEKKGAPAQLHGLVGRVEAVEGRITSLHGMLTEENPVTGKKKLSPLGKRVKAFYGK